MNKSHKTKPKWFDPYKKVRKGQPPTTKVIDDKDKLHKLKDRHRRDDFHEAKNQTWYKHAQTNKTPRFFVFTESNNNKKVWNNVAYVEVAGGPKQPVTFVFKDGTREGHGWTNSSLLDSFRRDYYYEITAAQAARLLNGETEEQIQMSDIPDSEFVI